MNFEQLNDVIMQRRQPHSAHFRGDSRMAARKLVASVVFMEAIFKVRLENGDVFACKH